MTFPKEIIVTGQRLDLSDFSDTTKAFVLNFCEDVQKLYHQFEKDRIIIGIAGPSGAGKSLLATLAKELTSDIHVEQISIDAFHFPNAVLADRLVDGGHTLKDMKGRYDTYDTDLLAAKLKSFIAGEKVDFPEYSRELHEPVADVLSIPLGPCLLLVEGLWLLYDSEIWGRVGRLFAYMYFLNGNHETLRAHTILRHIRGGRTTRDAERQYDMNDAHNHDLVMQTRARANQEIIWPS